MIRWSHTLAVRARSVLHGSSAFVAAKCDRFTLLRRAVANGINHGLLSLRQHTEQYRTVHGEFTCRTAAPEGGAWTAMRNRVRGCVLSLALAATVTSAAQAQDVPSGQAVTLDEVLVDSVGAEAWLRFRFMAPQIARDGGSVSFDAARDDFLHLCHAVALPYMREFDLDTDVIVISMMDRVVPFGTSDPDATQFFEAFRIADGACAWDSY